MAKWEWYEKWSEKSVKRRGDDYDEIKNTIGEILIEQACQLFPQIRDHIDFKDIGMSSFYYKISAQSGDPLIELGNIRFAGTS